MNVNSENELDKILQARDIPKPSSNLAYRINQLAQETTNRKFDHLSLIDQVLRMFVVPKPAYATAFCLLFGLAIGFYTNSSDGSLQDWFLFLEMEEGDWL